MAQDRSVHNMVSFDETSVAVEVWDGSQGQKALVVCLGDLSWRPNLLFQGHD